MRDYMTFGGFEGCMLGIIATNPKRKGYLIKELDERCQEIAYCMRDIRSKKKLDKYSVETIQAAKAFINWADNS